MRKNITKSMLVDAVADQLGLMQVDAKCFVERFFEHIMGALLRGESVALSGFGNFVLLDKKARPGCNPRRPEQVVQISPRTVVSFHAGRKLRQHIQRLSLLTGSGQQLRRMEKQRVIFTEQEEKVV